MEIKIFQNKEFGEIQVLSINNEPWFIANEICTKLGITRQALSQRLTDDVSSTYPIKDSLGRLQNTLIINEDGLYDAIFESRKPEAKKFRKWVTSEVLPDIRKHGVYMTNDLLELTLENPDFMIDLLQKYKKERMEKLELAERNKMLVHSKKLYTSTEIAKELGFRSATAFNKDLELKKVQYKVNGTWVLHSKYSDLDYVSIKNQVLDNGKVIYDRKWTGLGREFLLQLYKGETNETSI